MVGTMSWALNTRKRGSLGEIEHRTPTRNQNQRHDDDAYCIEYSIERLDDGKLPNPHSFASAHALTTALLCFASPLLLSLPFGWKIPYHPLENFQGSFFIHPKFTVSCI